MRYDEKADALYLCLDESKIVESEEVQPGIVLDFNAGTRARVDSECVVTGPG